MGERDQAIRVLSPAAESASEARRFVASVLAGWERAAVTDVALLLVSDVVTNSVLHAGPHAWVTRCEWR